MKYVIENLNNCTIVGLYNRVAVEMNEVASSYDCTKIEVSTNIMDKIFNRMERDGYSPETRAMLWCCYGPKENKNLPDNTVDVQEGFIVTV